MFLTPFRHHDEDDALRDLPVSVTLDGSPLARVEPVTLDLVKKHLRFQTSSEDDLIATWIAAARMYFEEQTRRQCIDATWEYGVSRAPQSRHLVLPRPPLSSVVSIAYTDSDGNDQTFDSSNYDVLPSYVAPDSGDPVFDPYCGCGMVRLKSGASWPSTDGSPRSFRVRRVCGYGDTADVMPGMLQACLYLLIGHFHGNRTEVIASTSRATVLQLPMGASVMLEAFKWTAVPLNGRRHGMYGLSEGWPWVP